MQQKQLLEGSSQQHNFFKTQEQPQITSVLTHHPKECEIEEQTKPQASRRKQTLKIREEINKIEVTGKKEPNTVNSWFFDRVKNTDKALIGLTKKKGAKIQMK